MITDRERRASNHHSCRGDMYTDHQGTDDQCALMISVAPEVPTCPSVQLSVLNSATCQCPSATSMPHICLPMHINATYQCPFVLPFSVTTVPSVPVHVSAA
ncbi:unnamed protein product [Staurois parvus]|uniref:Uncharacterized protein n=1 Tax=Staurois parvus TaxID=386267 RepID=A0ABN9CXB1_9NEOB|nr:unnamed protein product [Staurois parvus]